MPCGQSVNGAIHFPRHAAIARHLEYALKPWVLRAHAFSQQPRLLNAVLIFLPKHVLNFLFRMTLASQIRVAEDAAGLHRRQLPQVARKNDVDAAEGPSLPAPSCKWESLASSLQISVQSTQKAG